jgi:hypothetical protein
MTHSTEWAHCAHCSKPVEPFGAMRHVFVDAEFRPLCEACARELVPERVAQAEADDARWRQADPSARRDQQ